MTASEKQMAYYGLGALAVYWFLFRADPVTGMTPIDSLAQKAGESAGQLPGAVAGGAIVGIGKSVGIPATDLTKCQQDIANQDTWNASFDCTASEFFSYLRS